MSPKNCFTLFPRLPTELRFKIWEIALSRLSIMDFRDQVDEKGKCMGGYLFQSGGHGSIARACKEAWRLMVKSHQRIELLLGYRVSRHRVATWIDFTNTIFYLGRGNFMWSSMETLSPDAISTRVKNVAIGWSTPWKVRETCDQLEVFQALQHVVILVPPRRSQGEAQRSLITPLDFQDLEFQLSGQITFTGTSAKDMNYLNSIIEKMIITKFQKLGRNLPIVDIVVSEFMYSPEWDIGC
ncbi:hypothetical protein G7Y89_g11124 [Cudoniella acicularis]|uniref:2EXR domain-containing protein n=1 Tax=Cudoniella acicularis TaxID=354080 RepID=A0A8H4VY46_9HELO|nr:hypothetical protein G7Y89_g11124 [Cudoniella acicularis]